MSRRHVGRPQQLADAYTRHALVCEKGWISTQRHTKQTGWYYFLLGDAVVIGFSFLFLPVCRNGSNDRGVTKAAKRWRRPSLPERAGGMNAFDPSYF